MKKLYRKGTVHPSPLLISDHLSFLPAAILTLAASLSPEDKEVLAYLISCSTGNFLSVNKRSNHKTSSGTGNGDHPSSFNCNCFGCYTSYWARWDSSPNRQLIHEIIDALEDKLASRGRREKGKRERKKRGSGRTDGSKPTPTPALSSCGDEESESESAEKAENNGVDGGGSHREDEIEVLVEKGPVRKFVSYVGERIWSVWS